MWDILGGGRLLAGFSNHQKTITSICLDGENRRLLSGSLDRYDAILCSMIGHLHAVISLLVMLL